MVQYIFTPWRDRAELLRVRAQFYPDRAKSSSPAAQDNDDDEVSSSPPQLAGQKRKRPSPHNPTSQQKHAAVARVSMWMQRGGCPHVVESTALLTAAALSDASAAAGEGSGAASMGVRAEYAMGFSRFVTGLLDIHQQMRHKQSMYSLARSVGLPPAFVELRHQIGHEALPPLRALRAGAERALEWMWGYYWVHIEDEDEDVPEERGERQCRSAVRGVLLGDTEGDVEGLRRWDVGMVVRLLLEAGEKEPKWMLEALRVAREVVGRTDGVVEGEEKQKVSLGQLSDIRAEVEEQRAQLRRRAQEDVQMRDVAALAESEAQGEADDGPAWREYSGVWVPKPIGVV